MRRRGAKEEGRRSEGGGEGAGTLTPSLSQSSGISSDIRCGFSSPARYDATKALGRRGRKGVEEEMRMIGKRR